MCLKSFVNILHVKLKHPVLCLSPHDRQEDSHFLFFYFWCCSKGFVPNNFVFSKFKIAVARQPWRSVSSTFALGRVVVRKDRTTCLENEKTRTPQEGLPNVRVGTFVTLFDTIPQQLENRKARGLGRGLRETGSKAPGSPESGFSPILRCVIR